MTKQIVTGIIGAGRIGKLHVQNISRIPHMKIKAVSDIQASRIKSWADSHQIEYITSDYRDLLHDPDIDAIFICSPTAVHAQMIKEAAEAKKHIFCEKPVSFSLDETSEALAAVRKHGVTLQVGFNRRFDPHFKKIKTIVENGEIGTPHLLKITSRDPEPPNIDYVRTSGGLFMDMSIHDFDMARYIMGSEVTEVYAKGAALVNPSFAELGDIDTAVITLTFENGAMAVIDNSRQAVYGYDQRVEVFGTKGSAAADNSRPTTVEVSTADFVMKDKPHFFFLERYKDSYEEEILRFAEAIGTNQETPCTGNDGLQAGRIARAAQQSLAFGMPVSIENTEKIAF
ncbi:inositol 2-dehydrogenase [Bacillus subtilis]|uniref:inositol 2-dehydrogenase n=1 Tax=Bacillus subtilis TaxID=1423 RepID=UPI00240DEEB1|nr:inositol 2-dehydrogenase [Bacillus subtilis]WEY87371.1 inositol 2-dehydrogenase [Bacillus subtilis]WEZ18676.1 inositol 2-dehydrogenase [Bacillus subtilis]